MNTYQKVSTVVALLLYLPLAWQILNGEVRQNLATWILWGCLDTIAATTLFLQQGNWYLPAAYVGGCTFTILCMLKTKTVSWGSFETLIALMVLICIIGWLRSGPRLATILSTTGVVMAGFPQIIDAYSSPLDMPLGIYIGYTLVNIIATKGGKEWSVEERLYPFACATLCGLIAFISCRKFLMV